MEKVLFTATVDSHIMNFHIPDIAWFNDNGYEVHVASNGNNEINFATKKYNIPFARNPLNKNNIKTFFMLRKIIQDNNYKIIHCHTPMGSVLTRLAAIKVRKKDTKVIYTAHGFHFFKGAKVKNWLVYYPIEKVLSKLTDCLITINNEDYNIAINNFYCKNVKYLDGVGIDLNKFTQTSVEVQQSLRESYCYGNNDFILIYVAELSHRKNQGLLIDAIDKVKNEIPNIKLLLVGSGAYEDKYKSQVRELNLDNNIKFLGYRKDISNLMQLSDVCVSSSRQEGLPVNIMEAMGTGLPVIVTDCRGNRDLIKDNRNGFVVNIDDIGEICKAIIKMHDSLEDREKFSKNNIIDIKKYCQNIVTDELGEIYNGILSN